LYGIVWAGEDFVSKSEFTGPWRWVIFELGAVGMMDAREVMLGMMPFLLEQNLPLSIVYLCNAAETVDSVAKVYLATL
jgi:hypothetical protein